MMVPKEHIDLTMSDDSDAVHQPLHRTPQKPQPLPPLHTRRPISPPALNRPASASALREHTPMFLRNNTTVEQKPRSQVKSASLTAKINSGDTARIHQGFTSPTTYRTPKQHTPKKIDWTTDRLEEALRGLSHNIGKDGAKVSARLLHVSWKKMAPTNGGYSKKNWFSNMKRDPTEAGQGTLKLKLKHISPGRSGKQEKREHYAAVGIQTDKEPVPKYGFHHVHINKNILSPNTMLNFVPHLRDLADHEEPSYRRWLENLESMDKTSGFATLSRQEKVHKTCQKERATTLLLYLDDWLNKLSVDSCSKVTLIRYMACQTDAVTPQQMSSILNSYNSEAGSPRSVKIVKMFTDAFNRVFDTGSSWEEGAVTLRDVLLLDKSVDNIVDSKKWIKDTPNQVKPVEWVTTVEASLETYALLGCLICCSHSCEHGEYGVDNERKRFSVEITGGLGPLVRKKAIQAGVKHSGHHQLDPCSEECYLNGRPGTRARGWSETEIMSLKTAAALLSDTPTAVQCLTAVYIGRPCWDVNRQLEKLDLQPPGRSQPTTIEVKAVHWYDRNKKMLFGDWQEQTITHEHHKKDHFDPCNHDGPCTKDNCDCVRNHLMCERFCRCTDQTCAIKFTGCACHSQGKTCLPRQRGEKPCICVQLNRECDPALCGTCGATDRANPRNVDDDQLFRYGCQNCALQRGKSKSVVHGRSTIEGCGYGLFAAENIAQDDFVIEYVGELISQDEGVRREARRGDVFDEESNSSYLFTLLEQEGIWVDAAIYGNLSRYINHQDDFGKGQGCNITPKILYVGGEYRIKFSALRDIDAGEELFFNYGENFPNLTKKLLDEQNKAEETAKKRHARKEPVAEEDEQKKPQGKKRGRKPKKKTKSFAARMESDADDEDLLPRSKANKSRKRKRDGIGSDSDEGYYRLGSPEPSLGLNTSHSKFHGRQRQDPVDGSNNLFGRIVRDRSEVQNSDLDMVDVETPRRLNKKTRKIVEDADDDEIDESLDAEYEEGRRIKRQSGGSTRRRAPADDSAAEETTPSRFRTRRQHAREALYLNPLPVFNPASDRMDPGHQVGPSFKTAAPDKQKKKRGRPRKVQPRDEIAETDDNADRNSMGRSTNARNKGSQSFANDSDYSSNGVRDLSRVRKRPARYED